MKTISRPVCANKSKDDSGHIHLKRAYESPEQSDGLRILVDRLWPRGVSKEKLQLDGWEKNLTPSSVLRKWFAHDANKWDEFRRLYLEELDNQREAARALLSRAEKSRLTLVYAARDERHNHALVLKEFLEKIT